MGEKMKQSIRARMLSIYDLFLATGAIYCGIQMVRSDYGIFSGEFPESWATNLPFDSWVMPGILAITIFGLGNIIASVFSFVSRGNGSWFVSLIMGALFFFGLIYQYILVQETYIVTKPFLILSVIQLCLSGYVFWGYRKGL